jgi:hypothetical protein
MRKAKPAVRNLERRKKEQFKVIDPADWKPVALIFQNSPLVLVLGMGSGLDWLL